MNRFVARAAAYGVVALLAAGSFRLIRPIEARRPAEVLTAPTRAVTSPVWTQRSDTLARGETLVDLLQRGGLARAEAERVLRQRLPLDARRVRAGTAMTVRALSNDSLPAEIVLQLATDRLVRLKRDGAAWSGTEERLAWSTDTVALAGMIRSNLFDALRDARTDGVPRSMRPEVAWTLADIFEYRVDMSRDLQPGDSVQALIERESTPNGAVRLGRVVAASITVSGRRIDAVHYRSAGAAGEYFDAEGKSLRAAFLRAPLAFRRISSVFGMRFHPILNSWRAHRGTDYAAAGGTPVRSIGDGVVIFSGRKSGFGNVLEVRHRNGYVSRYGHLRGFARGIRAGSRVTIAQTIGFVGMTGLATAPHLHFEVLVGGVQRDPRVALSFKGGEPIPSGEREAFGALRSQLQAQLRTRLLAQQAVPPVAGGGTRLAASNIR